MTSRARGFDGGEAGGAAPSTRSRTEAPAITRGDVTRTAADHLPRIFEPHARAREPSPRATPASGSDW